MSKLELVDKLDLQKDTDAVVSKTYPQQAGTIHQNGFIVIKGRPCKVSLLTSDGNTKDGLKLPTDEQLLKQIKDGFEEGKGLVLTVQSAMGEEQICALKDKPE
nr:unnamed protein product [Digitaria exilis]